MLFPRYLLTKKPQQLSCGLFCYTNPNQKKVVFYDNPIKFDTEDPLRYDLLKIEEKNINYMDILKHIIPFHNNNNQRDLGKI